MALRRGANRRAPSDLDDVGPFSKVRTSGISPHKMSNTMAAADIQQQQVRPKKVNGASYDVYYKNRLAISPVGSIGESI
jgi:hypothetical protein